MSGDNYNKRQDIDASKLRVSVIENNDFSCFPDQLDRMPVKCPRCHNDFEIPTPIVLNYIENESQEMFESLLNGYKYLVEKHKYDPLKEKMRDDLMEIYRRYN